MVNLYRQNDEDGNTVLACPSCASDLKKDGNALELIDVAADGDICEVCGEVQEFHFGEFDNGARWQGLE